MCAWRDDRDQDPPDVIGPREPSLLLPVVAPRRTFTGAGHLTEGHPAVLPSAASRVTGSGRAVADDAIRPAAADRQHINHQTEHVPARAVCVDRQLEWAGVETASVPEFLQFSRPKIFPLIHGDDALLYADPQLTDFIAVAAA